MTIRGGDTVRTTHLACLATRRLKVNLNIQILIGCLFSELITEKIKLEKLIKKKKINEK